MRVTADTEVVDLTPGGSAELGLEIVNTSAVIDGVTARVVGLADHHVSTRPAVLPLFPDSSGRMTLTLGVPSEFPAGRHPISVEVLSRQPDSPAAYLDLDLQVPQTPAIDLEAGPQRIRSHRTARYVITVNNRGNVPLDVTVSATDPERTIALRIEPGALTIPPGSAVDTVLTARGPRMVLGTELDRPINVTAAARVIDPARASRQSAPTRTGRPVPVGVEADPSADLHDGDPDDANAARPEALAGGVALTLRQRPWLTRGLLTALILLAIIAAWAAVFLFGLGQVFAGDPLTKSAPPSFFAVADAAGPGPAAGQRAGDAPGPPSPGADTASVQGARAGAAAGNGGTADRSEVAPAGESGGAGHPTPAAALVAGPAPAGALPKGGALPPGTSGVISGTVTAVSDQGPVGRIQVDALRRNRSGQLVVAGSAASQSDGSFEIAGLFPGDYLIRMSADGFDTTFAPAADGPAAATVYPVAAGEITTVVDAVVTGHPATISGTVDPGDTVKPTTTKVAVRDPDAGADSEPVATATTDAQGRYTLPDLPAPAEYRLVFTTDGYQTSTVQTTVGGGVRRIQPTIVLRAGPGRITGTVTDGTDPIGGANVTVTVGGEDRSTGTPTTGTIGRFVLGDLPTPATYVVTATADGYTSRAVVVDLKPGQKQKGLTIELTKGSGRVTGRLVDSDGNGLGGATVSVGGAADQPGTTTLTSGTVGAFELQQLPTPGSYTLTFTLPGYADQTVPLVLDGTGHPPLTVTMASALGRITGTVTTSDGGPLGGVTVTATDGVQSWPVASAGTAGVVPAGGYLITGLTPGTYTVTAAGPDGTGRTALVTVSAGATATQDFTVPGS